MIRWLNKTQRKEKEDNTYPCPALESKTSLVNISSSRWAAGMSLTLRDDHVHRLVVKVAAEGKHPPRRDGVGAVVSQRWCVRLGIELEPRRCRHAKARDPGQGVVIVEAPKIGDWSGKVGRKR